MLLHSEKMSKRKRYYIIFIGCLMVTLCAAIIAFCIMIYKVPARLSVYATVKVKSGTKVLLYRVTCKAKDLIILVKSSSPLDFVLIKDNQTLSEVWNTTLFRWDRAVSEGTELWGTNTSKVATTTITGTGSCHITIFVTFLITVIVLLALVLLVSLAFLLPKRRTGYTTINSV